MIALWLYNTLENGQCVPKFASCLPNAAHLKADSDSVSAWSNTAQPLSYSPKLDHVGVYIYPKITRFEKVITLLFLTSSKVCR